MKAGKRKTYIALFANRLVQKGAIQWASLENCANVQFASCVCSNWAGSCIVHVVRNCTLCASAQYKVSVSVQVRNVQENSVVQVCVQLCVCARTGPGLASLPCNALPPAAPPKLNAIIRNLERSFENCNVWYCEEAELIKTCKEKGCAKEEQLKAAWD